ncbi:uncharacterized protein LOC119464982 [Dermacentor silvarum]|uniref:uncharacterized protein LOC119464982 n=1 Tax=Dermacentor silvarum TaxID=543639 RepID=UPI001898E10D|nr:uncharacterized protein LOC119464982 [Dermacentor silvarum]
MVSVTEELFVKKRNYKTNTKYRCLSALLVEDLGSGEYDYQLSAREEGGTRVTYYVTVTANTTGNHPEPNAAIYPEDPFEGKMNHKIVTMDDKHSCFVLVRVTGGTNRECYLAMTQSTVKGTIPHQCESAYTTYCGGKSLTLYEDDC